MRGIPAAKRSWMPRIPYICITKPDGERLTRLSRERPIVATLTAEITHGWRTVPTIIADVPGRRPAFVLVATHFDAWSTLPRDGHAFGFLETEMIRGRNEVEARIREVTDELEQYLPGPRQAARGGRPVG